MDQLQRRLAGMGAGDQVQVGGAQPQLPGVPGHGMLAAVGLFQQFTEAGIVLQPPVCLLARGAIAGAAAQARIEQCQPSLDLGFPEGLARRVLGIQVGAGLVQAGAVFPGQEPVQHGVGRRSRRRAEPLRKLCQQRVGDRDDMTRAICIEFKPVHIGLWNFDGRRPFDGGAILIQTDDRTPPVQIQNLIEAGMPVRADMPIVQSAARRNGFAVQHFCHWPFCLFAV